jgi:hypothetical protein
MRGNESFDQPPAGFAAGAVDEFDMLVAERDGDD